MAQDQTAPDHASTAAAVATGTAAIAGECSAGTVSVSMTNQFGKLYLWGWNTGCTGNEDFVAIYKGTFPDDPDNKVAWKYVKEFGDAWDTGQIWGPGWVAAYVSRDYRRGRTWTYVCKTGPIQETN